jgi:hypothetical protein
VSCTSSSSSSIALKHAEGRVSGACGLHGVPHYL